MKKTRTATAGREASDKADAKRIGEANPIGVTIIYPYFETRSRSGFFFGSKKSEMKTDSRIIFGMIMLEDNSPFKLGLLLDDIKERAVHFCTIRG